MSDEAVMRKLVKLLELAQRGDEHEAQVAAERAAELMARHEIDAAEIEAARTGEPAKPATEEGRIDDDSPDGTSRVENWHKALLCAVAKALGGRPYMRGRGRQQQFMMIGPRDSVAAARYVYMHLERQINRLSRAATRDVGETNAWRRSWAVGCVIRVSERLEEGRATAMRTASTTALVVVDRTKQAIDALVEAMGMRDAKPGRRKRSDATGYGYDAGDGVDLGNQDSRRLNAPAKELKS